MWKNLVNAPGWFRVSEHHMAKSVHLPCHIPLSHLLMPGPPDSDFTALYRCADIRHGGVTSLNGAGSVDEGTHPWGCRV